MADRQRAWLLIEHDGEDPRFCPIVEVSLAVSDTDLVEQTALTLLINPRLTARWAKWEPSSDLPSPVMREWQWHGVSISAAEKALIETLDRVSDEVFACSVSAVELPFLIAQMPRLVQRLDLEDNFDLVSLRRGFVMADRAGLIPSFRPPRRQMQALLSRLSEARVLVESIRSLSDEE